MSFFDDYCPHLIGDHDYEDGFYEQPLRRRKNRRPKKKLRNYNEYYYHINLNERLIQMGVMSKKDKLTIKFSTEKAHLFAINDQPLFWAPKKLVRKIVSPKEFFYIHNCFDIYKQLITYGGEE